ncbi:MAG: hypothetical protein AAGG56_18800 [Pseudomonadota bacterium]
MINIRPALTAAMLCASFPVAGHASSADATFDIFVDYTITAPGATVSVLDADSFFDPFQIGTGLVDFALLPDPFVISDPLDVEASFIGSLSATDPFGFADILGAAFFAIEITNPTGAPIPVSVDYDIDIELTAEIVPGLEFADAFIFMNGGISVESDALGPLINELFDFTADGRFGPPSDGLDISGTFSGLGILPDDTLIVAGGASLAGFAEVAPIPLPGGLLLGLTGLAGLGLLRARRA